MGKVGKQNFRIFLNFSQFLSAFINFSSTLINFYQFGSVCFLYRVRSTILVRPLVITFGRKLDFHVWPCTLFERAARRTFVGLFERAARRTFMELFERAARRKLSATINGQVGISWHCSNWLRFDGSRTLWAQEIEEGVKFLTPHRSIINFYQLFLNFYQLLFSLARRAIARRASGAKSCRVTPGGELLQLY